MHHFDIILISSGRKIKPTSLRGGQRPTKQPPGLPRYARNDGLMLNQTLIFPSAISNNVNAISATAATPKSMQIMNIVCSMETPFQ
jgi:hypothetical protein